MEVCAIGSFEWNCRLVFCEIDTRTIQWYIGHSFLFTVSAHRETDPVHILILFDFP